MNSRFANRGVRPAGSAPGEVHHLSGRICGRARQKWLGGPVVRAGGGNGAISRVGGAAQVELSDRLPTLSARAAVAHCSLLSGPL